MLIVHHTMRGIVMLVRDWHPGKLSSRFGESPAYRNYTSGGTRYQEAIFAEKMRDCKARVRRRIEELS